MPVDATNDPPGQRGPVSAQVTDRLITAHRPVITAQYVLVTVPGRAAAVWATTVVTQRSGP